MCGIFGMFTVARYVPLADCLDRPLLVMKNRGQLGIKVFISGIGGDELFQGYPSFWVLPRLVMTWQAASRIPRLKPLASLLASAQTARTRNSRWRYAPAWAGSIVGAWGLRRSLFGPDDLPHLFAEEWHTIATDELNVQDCIDEIARGLQIDSTLALGAIESTTYLRNHMLRNSNWASMDYSVDLRTPLVDAPLLRELQPLHGWFSHYPKKRLVADAPRKPLPMEIITRPKTGFGIPIAQWLAPAAASLGGHSKGWAKQVARAYSGAPA